MTGKFEKPRKVITGVALVEGKTVESFIEVEGYEVIEVKDNMKDCVTARLSYLHSSGYTDERKLWDDKTPVTYEKIGAWGNDDVAKRIEELV